MNFENSLKTKDNPNNQERTQSLQTLINFFDKGNALHRLIEDHIENDGLDEIKSFLKKFPNSKAYKNKDKPEAVVFALSLKKYDVYELLVSEEISEEVQKQLEKKFSELDLVDKMKIRDIQKKQARSHPFLFFSKLVKKCKLAVSTPDKLKDECFRLIEEAFRTLNQVKEVQLILEIFAGLKNSEIIFDFTRDHIRFTDPTKSERVYGTFYQKSKTIYIGSKGIMDKTERLDVLGTLAHELCHFALYVTYSNESNPFYKEDEETKRKFQEIASRCEEKKGEEVLIDEVFMYGEEFKLSELIVRVPHLLVLNKEDFQKQNELRENFQELFHFYQDIVMIDFEKKLLFLEDEKKIEKLNKQIGMLSFLEKSNILNDLMLDFEESLDKSNVMVITNFMAATMEAIFRRSQKNTPERISRILIIYFFGPDPCPDPTF